MYANICKMWSERTNSCPIKPFKGLDWLLFLLVAILMHDLTWLISYTLTEEF